MAPAREARHDGDWIHALLERNHNDRHGGNGRDTCRKAIKTVNEVHDIGQADNPKNSKGNGKIIQIKITTPRVIEPLDADTKKDGNQSRHNLSHEFDLGRQLDHIVDHANSCNCGTAQENPDDIRCQFKCCERRRHKANKNGKTAMRGMMR